MTTPCPSGWRGGGHRDGLFDDDQTGDGRLFDARRAVSDPVDHHARHIDRCATRRIRGNVDHHVRIIANCLQNRLL